MKEEEVQAAQQTENGAQTEEVKKDVNKMNIKELKAGKDEKMLGICQYAGHVFDNSV